MWNKCLDRDTCSNSYSDAVIISIACRFGIPSFFISFHNFWNDWVRDEEIWQNFQDQLHFSCLVTAVADTSVSGNGLESSFSACSHF